MLPLALQRTWLSWEDLKDGQLESWLVDELPIRDLRDPLSRDYCIRISLGTRAKYIQDISHRVRFEGTLPLVWGVDEAGGPVTLPLGP